jgi:hypothetical protein
MKSFIVLEAVRPSPDAAPGDDEAADKCRPSNNQEYELSEVTHGVMWSNPGVGKSSNHTALAPELGF